MAARDLTKAIKGIRLSPYSALAKMEEVVDAAERPEDKVGLRLLDRSGRYRVNWRPRLGRKGSKIRFRNPFKYLKQGPGKVDITRSDITSQIRKGIR